MKYPPEIITYLQESLDSGSTISQVDLDAETEGILIVAESGDVTIAFWPSIGEVTEIQYLNISSRNLSKLREKLYQP